MNETLGATEWQEPHLAVVPGYPEQAERMAELDRVIGEAPATAGRLLWVEAGYPDYATNAALGFRVLSTVAEEEAPFIDEAYGERLRTAQAQVVNNHDYEQLMLDADTVDTINSMAKVLLGKTPRPEQLWSAYFSIYARQLAFHRFIEQLPRDTRSVLLASFDTRDDDDEAIAV